MEKKDRDFVKKVASQSQDAFELAYENNQELQGIRAEVKNMVDAVDSFSKAQTFDTRASVASKTTSTEGQLILEMSFLEHKDPFEVTKLREDLTSLVSTFIIKNRLNYLKARYSI